MGDSGSRVPSLWLQPEAALTIADFWGLDPWMGSSVSLDLSLCFSNKRQINFKNRDFASGDLC